MGTVIGIGILVVICAVVAVLVYRRPEQPGGYDPFDIGGY